jgi:hypothetical protein
MPLSSGTVLGQLLELTFQIEFPIPIQNTTQRKTIATIRIVAQGRFSNNR